jgi:hypothetical protein
MKAYRWSATMWRWAVSLVPSLLYPRGRNPWYSLNRRIDTPRAGVDVSEK